MGNKVCNTCKRELPANEKYFYKFKHAKDGLKSSCKECQGGKFIKKETLPNGIKRCGDCKEAFPETNEHFNTYKNAKGEYKFKSHCIECGKVRSKDWRIENIDKYTDYHKAYAKTDACKVNRKRYEERNKDKVRRYKKDYRIKNADRIREYNSNRRANPEIRKKLIRWNNDWKEKNQEHIRNYNRKYAQENKEYFRLAAHKRNQKINKLKFTLTIEQWEGTLKEFNNKCAYCGCSGNLHQEHVIPVTKDGGYTKENIIPACKSCNSSKWNRDMEEWYRSREYFSEERLEKIKRHTNQTVLV